MFKNKLLLPVNLSLFDGEGTGATGGGAETNNIPANSQQGTRANKNPLSNVVYGKSETQTESQTQKGEKSEAGTQTNATLTPEQRKAEFDKLITGDYKDLFQERTQGIINNRFKETKQLQSQIEAIRPAMDVLSQKYGTDDPAKIVEAIMADDANWEDAADKMGMTIEQYKEYSKVQAENKALRQNQQAFEQQNYANQQYGRWTSEAAQLVGTPEAPGEYPSLNLEEECVNPQFLSMIRAGASVKAAYEVVHIDDIKKSVAITTAKKVESNVTANIQAKGMRPHENGVQGQNTGVIYKNDPRQWDKKDREEIARRAARGETIKF